MWSVKDTYDDGTLSKATIEDEFGQKVFLETSGQKALDGLIENFLANMNKSP